MYSLSEFEKHLSFIKEKYSNVTVETSEILFNCTRKQVTIVDGNCQIRQLVHINLNLK